MFSKGHINGTNSVNTFWMNLDQIKVAITKNQLLGLEPYYVLKNLLERKQTNSLGKIWN